MNENALKINVSFKMLLKENIQRLLHIVYKSTKKKN